MILRLPCFRNFILGVCLAAPYGLCAGEIPGEASPRQGLLVLANGNVIEGSVKVDADTFTVLVPNGKLRVRTDQVDFFCDSLEEAYVRRRARRISSTTSLDAHLEMARWCVNQRLFAYAEREIEQARRLNPDDQQVDRVERLLDQARKLSQRTHGDESKTDEKVVLASAPSEPPELPVVDIPVWARTEFVKRVQPMLVNSCATAGCHVPNSPQRLQIDRTALDGVGNPDLFQRNLSAVVGMVDPADPQNSLLLKKASEPHGLVVAVPSRPLTQHQFEILRAWILQLSMDEQPQEHNNSRQVPQVVIGMNSSGQQRSDITSSEAPSSDPFDPSAFNAEQAQSADDPEAAIPPEIPAEPAQ